MLREAGTESGETLVKENPDDKISGIPLNGENRFSAKQSRKSLQMVRVLSTA